MGVRCRNIPWYSCFKSGEVMTEPKKLYMNEVEVAATRSVSVRLLRNMRMRGEGPVFVKVSGRLGCRGGRILYPVADLDAWLSSLPRGGGQGAVVGGNRAASA